MKPYPQTRKFLYGAPSAFHDEAFSSWLFRLAAWFRMSRSNIDELFGLSRLLNAYDFDITLSAEVLENFARTTGNALEDIKLLASCRPALLRKERFATCKFIPRTLSLYLACPRCLQQDTVPYLRQEWRYPWTEACSVHPYLLTGICSSCGAELDYSKPNRQFFHAKRGAEIGFCPQCMCVLSPAYSDELPLGLWHRLKSAQQRISAIACDGYFSHERLGTISAYQALKLFMEYEVDEKEILIFSGIDLRKTAGAAYQQELDVYRNKRIRSRR